MFVLAADPRFAAAVEMVVPTLDGPVEARFTAEFRALGLGDLPDFAKLDAAGTRAFLQRVLVGWRELVDEDGAPVAFDEALRDRIIDLVWARRALVLAYIHGLAPAARGN